MYSLTELPRSHRAWVSEPLDRASLELAANSSHKLRTRCPTQAQIVPLRKADRQAEQGVGQVQPA